MTDLHTVQRVDRLDADVRQLQVDVSHISASVDDIRKTNAAIFAKIEDLQVSSGTYTATRGMLPMTYVWSGLGLIGTFTAIGLTITSAGAGVMWLLLTQKAEQTELKVQLAEAEAARRIETLEARVEERFRIFGLVR